MSYSSQQKGFAAGLPGARSFSGGEPANFPWHQETTLAQLRPLFATNPHRRTLWYKLICFLGWPVFSGKFSYLYLDGGFMSAKPDPHDIDIVLQTREPYGPAAFKAIEPFFAAGLDSIFDTYSVHLHFWMENSPPGMIDFRSFFLQNRRNPAHTCLGRDVGLFQISLLQPGIREALRQEMETATRPAEHRAARSR